MCCDKSMFKDPRPTCTRHHTVKTDGGWTHGEEELYRKTNAAGVYIVRAICSMCGARTDPLPHVVVRRRVFDIGNLPPMPGYEPGQGSQIYPYQQEGHTPNRPAQRQIQRLYGDGNMSDSPAESALLEGLQVAGITGFEQQYCIRGGSPAFHVDFAFPHKRLAIEIDGWTYHNSEESFTSDRQRDRMLARRGWTVLRFTAKEVMTETKHCTWEIAGFLG